jgi:hypothetical protein
MSRGGQGSYSQNVDQEWVTFPGGELEGARPKVRCPACRHLERQRLRSGLAAEREGDSGSGPICFQCYRTDQARQRALKAAGELFTASEARFQTTLPFEPVNRARLDRLRVDRSAARAQLRGGIGRFAVRRRRAQIDARHALERISAALKKRERSWDAAHAAELQLPDAWLPFVSSR